MPKVSYSTLVKKNPWRSFLPEFDSGMDGILLGLSPLPFIYHPRSQVVAIHTDTK